MTQNTRIGQNIVEMRLYSADRANPNESGKLRILWSATGFAKEHAKHYNNISNTQQT